MAAMRQTARDAALSRYLSAWHSARYLGISARAFDGWAWRYKIPHTMIDGQRRYLREDLDRGLAAFNDAMRRSNAHWQPQPPMGA